MMTFPPTILFVTTDIYEKIKSWFMTNIIKMLLLLHAYADNKHFPKNFVFSQFHLTKRMTFTSKFTKLHS
jgi:hypothetical protein